jgi:hypothetical protein
MSTTQQTSITSPPKGQRGHTQARAPIISLDQPGRLRVAHLLAVLAISHATLYAGLKTGRYPPPDGRDGKFPYWKTGTVKAFLDS